MAANIRSLSVPAFWHLWKTSGGAGPPRRQVDCGGRPSALLTCSIEPNDFPSSGALPYLNMAILHLAQSQAQCEQLQLVETDESCMSPRIRKRSPRCCIVI